VAVPAALALDVLAEHRLVAREDVLEHAREHVVGAGSPVGGRRALVEDELLGALAAADRLAEDRRARASARAPPARGRGSSGVLGAGDEAARSEECRSRVPPWPVRSRPSGRPLVFLLLGARAWSSTSTATRTRSRSTTSSPRTSRARSGPPSSAAPTSTSPDVTDFEWDHVLLAERSAEPRRDLEGARRAVEGRGRVRHRRPPDLRPRQARRPLRRLPRRGALRRRALARSRASRTTTPCSAFATW
jgi:hypothetical protein